MAEKSGLKYSCPQHAKDLLQNLQELRRNNGFYDFTLVIDDKDVPVQRNVLAAGSSYFRSLFNYSASENSDRRLVISLPELDVPTFELVLDYIYTGEVTLNQDNIQDVFQASDVLLMANLKKLCCDYLEQCISAANCIGIRNFTERYSCPWIHYLATECMEANFSDVCRHEEFLQQSAECVKEILSRDQLQLQIISRRSEEIIFDAAMRWIKHNVADRRKHLKELLGCVRFHYISSHYYQEHIATESLILEEPGCKEEVDRVYYGELFKSPLDLRGYYDVIVVSGGVYKPCNSILSTVRCVVPFHEQPQWVDLPPMMTPRADHAMVSAGGFLFAVGGRNEGDQILNTGEKYDPQTNTWTAIAPMREARELLGLVAIDDCIYAIGGIRNGTVKTMEAYDIYKDRWEDMPPMKIARETPACAVMQKKIFVIGGCHDGQVFDAVECFDPVSKTWSVVAPLKERRFCPSAVGVKDKLFVFGGLRNLLCPSAQNEMKFCGTELYHSETNTWHLLSSVNNGMCTMTTSSGLYGALHIQGFICVIGWLDTGYSYHCVRCIPEDGWQLWQPAVKAFPDHQSHMKCASLRIPCKLYYTMLEKTGKLEGDDRPGTTSHQSKKHTAHKSSANRQPSAKRH
ncbi:gigaxonin-like [Ptychodera flava]|uniref:gigaxonin-like n=1 Tax=Ptychodera flava TaxID=63121 RepID=UPI00396A6DFB